MKNAILAAAAAMVLLAAPSAKADYWSLAAQCYQWGVPAEARRGCLYAAEAIHRAKAGTIKVMTEEHKKSARAASGYRDPGIRDLCPPPHKMTEYDGCR